jgi:hypothetical protein
LVETEEAEFVTRFAKALRRSKKIPSHYKGRLRKLQALDSLLKVRRLNEGMVTSNDYRDLVLATVADQSLPIEVRQRMKDIAVQVLSPDDEYCDFRDKEMEQLAAKILSGKLDQFQMAQLYMEGTLERVMKYIENMMERASDGQGGYDEELLDTMTRRRSRKPGMWGPDKLIQMDFLYRNFSEYFGRSDANEVMRKKIVNTLSAYGRSLEKKKGVRTGPEHSDVKRPFTPGDDIDTVDFEETLDAIVNSGRPASDLLPDDIIVRDEVGETVTAVLLQDVSYSMFEYLGSVIPCFITLYSALKSARKGVCIFAGNGYPVKGIDDDIEDEKVVGAYYSMINASLSHSLTRGTMGVAAFKWAEDQLERAGGGRKIVFLFSDCGFDEYGSPLETVRRMNERGAEVVVVHPDIERGYFGWGPYGGPNLVHHFERGGCKVLDCSAFSRFVSQLEEVL